MLCRKNAIFLFIRFYSRGQRRRCGIIMKISYLRWAIEKGQQYVNTHTPKEVAKVIAPQFKDTDRKTIEKIVKRYAEQDSYKENTKFEKESFVLIQDILEEAGELEKRVEYETLVTTEFSEKY